MTPVHESTADNHSFPMQPGECVALPQLSRVAQSVARLTQEPEVPDSIHGRGWSGGAMVLGKLPVPGRPTIWIAVGQGHFALAVGAGGGCLDIFPLIYSFSSLSPSLWETARYRLKYCLKGSLNPKQPTNQIDTWSGHLLSFQEGQLSVTGESMCT